MKINGEERCIACMHILEQDGSCSHCHYEETAYTADVSFLPVSTILNNRYIVGKVVGEGGFGITYIGWDIVLEVAVAVKEYFPGGIAGRNIVTQQNNLIHIFQGENSSDYEKGLQSFLREARVLSRFSDLEDIVVAKDFFHENNTAYLVMQYVEGISIKKYVQDRGRMEPEQIFDMIKPIICSLERVHEQNIVHRDISSDNLMLTGEGRLKLIDFGATRPSNAVATKSVTMMFKRGYSAEEQYRELGKQGAWTDVYGLCATIYYMLTGIVPEESVERVIHDRLVSLVDMPELSMSSQWKKAVMKGLEVFAEQRYPSMSELYEDLYGESIVRKDLYMTHAEKEDEENTSKAISYTAMKRDMNEMEQMKQKKKRSYSRIMGIVMLVLIAGVGMWYVLGHQVEDGGQMRGRDFTSATSSVSVVPTAMPTATPTPQFQVPEYSGEKWEKVKKSLKKNEIKYRVKWKYNGKIKRNHVINQSPKAGKMVEIGSQIVLSISKGAKSTAKPVATRTPIPKTSSEDEKKNKVESLDDFFG